MRTLSIDSKPEHENPASHTAPQFMQLMDAFKAGRVSLVPATIKSTGERVAICCALNKTKVDGKPGFHFVPFAAMFNDPAELCATPDADIMTIAPDGKWTMAIEDMAKDSVATFADSSGKMFDADELMKRVMGGADDADECGNPFCPTHGAAVRAKMAAKAAADFAATPTPAPSHSPVSPARRLDPIQQEKLAELAKDQKEMLTRYQDALLSLSHFFATRRKEVTTDGERKLMEDAARLTAEKLGLVLPSA